MKKLLILLLSLVCYLGYSQSSQILQDTSFSNGTSDWSVTGSITISDDTLRNAGSAWGSFYQVDGGLNQAMEASTDYTLKFTVVTSGDATIAFRSTTNNEYYPGGGRNSTFNSGTWEIQFTTPSTIGDGGFKVQVWNTSDAFTIDDISLLKNATIGDSPYFVAPNGNNAYSGSIDYPWRTFEKAASIAQAGDTVYFRGGVYYSTPEEGDIDLVFIDSASTSDNICYSGEPGNPICFFGYPPDKALGDSAIFDFSLIEPPNNYPLEGYTDAGFFLAHMGYWHMKDLVIRNVWQKYPLVYSNGVNCYGPHNMTYENITLYNIGGWGFFSSTYDWDLLSRTDTSRWINCDFHHCIDSFGVNQYQLDHGQAGTQAVGLFVVNYPGCYYEISGCRSWKCSDDGFNFVPIGGEIYVHDTWSFLNGYYLDYLEYETSGNGFKLNNPTNNAAQIDRVSRHPELINHLYVNLIGAFNIGYAFNENRTYPGGYVMSRRMYNSVAYKNGSYGFAHTATPLLELTPPRINLYQNNLSYSNGSSENRNYFLVSENNTWDPATGVTVTDADFLTVDSATIVGYLLQTRQSDGSLVYADLFGLASTSDLIDAGTTKAVDSMAVYGITYDYEGVAPDIGIFEYNVDEESSDNDIAQITFSGIASASTVIDTTNKTVYAVAGFTANNTSLAPIFTTSPGASISPTAAQDFSNGPITYTVTAADESEQAWAVTIKKRRLQTIGGVPFTVGGSYIYLDDY